jgi:McrBC 5-methylcytosine restriction system component
MPPRRQQRQRPRWHRWTATAAPEGKRLYRALDHGSPISLRQSDFAPASRTGGWGTFAESFFRLNERALLELDVTAKIIASSPEPTLQLIPGARTGAIPLRSAQTGGIAAGLLVQPRFGWSGVGEVMGETGWTAAPHFLEFPLVPGSARDVPPWVLAGPVLARLADLLRSLGRGYEVREERRELPRGRILWPRYLTESLARGQWHQLPCMFPDLVQDPYLRRAIRWAIERVRGELIAVGGRDPIAQQLSEVARLLLLTLLDVVPTEPRGGYLERRLKLGPVSDLPFKRGVEALGWVVDERGLGGGRELDGLAWQLPLDELWERYVEGIVRREVAKEGGEVLVGRLGQTTIPIQWSESGLRSLGHLVPDIVVRRGRSFRIIDAKYKAHLADLDEAGWRAASEPLKEAHRADLHQVLAYASVFDAEHVTASLVYPLRRSTWEALHAKNQERWRAELPTGGRMITLELRGLPFGSHVQT